MQYSFWKTCELYSSLDFSHSFLECHTTGTLLSFLLPTCLLSNTGSDPQTCLTFTPTCTRCQEVATYLTDFIDLSNFPAGLLPGDSFLLRRKANRFFMSLALRERNTVEGKNGRKVGKSRRIVGWGSKIENGEGGENTERKPDKFPSP